MRRIALSALALASFPVWAEGDAPAAPPSRWELGAFTLGVSQQAYPGADQQVQRTLVLPYLLYRGPLLRSDGETTGLRALRTAQFEFDVGFAAPSAAAPRAWTRAAACRAWVPWWSWARA
ncbi:MAG: hypothetical protein U1E77_12530 [Inhella sp.]